jgi:hypothetical protein
VVFTATAVPPDRSMAVQTIVNAFGCLEPPSAESTLFAVLGSDRKDTDDSVIPVSVQATNPPAGSVVFAVVMIESITSGFLAS